MTKKVLFQDGKPVLKDGKLVLTENVEDCICCNPDCKYLFPKCENTGEYPELRNIGVEINIPIDTWDFEFNYEYDYRRIQTIDNINCITESSRNCIKMYERSYINSFRKISLTGLSAPTGTYIGELLDTTENCNNPLTAISIPSYFIATGTYSFREHWIYEVETYGECEFGTEPYDVICEDSVPIIVYVTVNVGPKFPPSDYVSPAQPFFYNMGASMILVDIPSHISSSPFSCNLGSLGTNYGINGSIPNECVEPGLGFGYYDFNTPSQYPSPYRYILNDKVLQPFLPNETNCDIQTCVYERELDRTGLFITSVRNCLQNFGSSTPKTTPSIPETSCADTRQIIRNGFLCGNFLNPSNPYTETTDISWNYSNTEFGIITMELFHAPL